MKGATLGGAQMSPMHAQLPDQHRRGESRRSGESRRIGAKKGFGINRNIARVGDHAGRPTIGPRDETTTKDPTRPSKAGGDRIEAGMSSRTAARIAVLMGGRSAEREVSLVSGRECAAALRQEGFEVVEIDAGADLARGARRGEARRRLQRAARPLGRGRLRPGHPRMARHPLHAFGRARLGAGDGQAPRQADLRRRRPAGGAGHDRLPRACAGRASDGAALCGQAEQRGLVGRGLHRAGGRQRAAAARRRHARTGCWSRNTSPGAS